MLGQRCKRWYNIKTVLGECLVFAGTMVEWSPAILKELASLLYYLYDLMILY